MTLFALGQSFVVSAVCKAVCFNTLLKMVQLILSENWSNTCLKSYFAENCLNSRHYMTVCYQIWQVLHCGVFQV